MSSENGREAGGAVASRPGGWRVALRYRVKGKTRHQNAREGLNPAGRRKRLKLYKNKE